FQMASNFVQAKSDNLPMIDSWMIAEYFSGNICHSAAEIRGAKEKRLFGSPNVMVMQRLASLSCKEAETFVRLDAKYVRSTEYDLKCIPSPKPILAGVGTNIEFLSSKDLGADDIPEFEDGDNFFEEMIQTAGSSKCNSELIKIYQPASPVEQLDVHLIVIKFKEDLANDFLMYASNMMTEELCVEACIQTQEQYKNIL
ncbi:hypothetical protein CBL_21399, partial [Carabus blaptoides fortunei]